MFCRWSNLDSGILKASVGPRQNNVGPITDSNVSNSLTCICARYPNVRIIVECSEVGFIRDPGLLNPVYQVLRSLVMMNVVDKTPRSSDVNTSLSRLNFVWWVVRILKGPSETIRTVTMSWIIYTQITQGICVWSNISLYH